MLVDFDKTFKQKSDDEQFRRIFDRLKSEKRCVMCENSRIEKGYEHGYETYNTICKITGMFRNGENGVNCPYWVVVEEEKE